MSFGLPIFFWAALALIPLAAVYFIRTRPRRQTVNTFFLWQKVFQQKSARSLFQRLRNLLSLLLLALAFLAAVLALTKPRLDDGSTPDFLIIIDASASMQALENGESRLSLAKKMADSWITALSGSQRAAIASVSDKLEYQTNLTTRTRALRDALRTISPTDLALNPQALAELSLLSTNSTDAQKIQKKTRILFLTDSRSPAFDLPAGIETVNIGSEKATNLGIIAADLHWDSPAHATLFATVLSTYSEEKTVELEIVSALDKRLIRLFSMKVPPADSASESFIIDDIQPGAYLLRARTEDAFPLDDSVALGLNTPQPIPIQISAENPFFLNQVVAAFSQANSLFAPIDGFANLSLAIGNPPKTPTAVVFAPAGESPFWSNLGAELPPGSPEIIAKDHPLLARLDPSLLTFEGAKKLTTPPGAITILAHSDGTPLLYTIATGENSAVIFNLDPARNDFYLSPLFPIFVHDATILLTGRGADFPATVPTGSSLEIPGTDPDGSITFRAIASDEAKTLPYQSPVALNKTGNYTLTRNATTWQTGAALLSPGESGPPTSGTNPLVKTPASGWSLVAWFLLAALALILAEELLYHRRKVG